jgi:hypothetical protein
VFGKYRDLLRAAHARLEAEPERYFPQIYGEKEGGGTQVLYLSKAGVSFEDLGLPVLGSEPTPELQQKIQHGIYQGFIAPAALYAGLSLVVWRNRKRTNEAGAREEDQP